MTIDPSFFAQTASPPPRGCTSYRTNCFRATGVSPAGPRERSVLLQAGRRMAMSNAESVNRRGFCRQGIFLSFLRGEQTFPFRQSLTIPRTSDQVKPAATTGTDVE